MQKRETSSQAQMASNYAPKTILEGILFMGCMLILWPLQDFRDKYRGLF